MQIVELKARFQRSRWVSTGLGTGLLVGLLFATGCSRSGASDPDADVREMVQSTYGTNALPVKERESDIPTRAPDYDPLTGRKFPKFTDGDLPAIDASQVVPVHQVGGAGSAYQPYNPETSEDSDFTDKADAFWKLDWLRKQLTGGQIPSNVEEAVKVTRQTLSKTKRDKYYAPADKALQHLEQGVEHLKAIKTLQAAHILRQNIPWGSGITSVQGFIASGGLGFGGKSPDLNRYQPKGEDDSEDEQDVTHPVADMKPSSQVVLSTAQRRALETITTYEVQYHDSPQALMRREWTKAAEYILEFRDMLRNHPSSRRHPGLNNAGNGRETTLSSQVGSGPITTEAPADLTPNTQLPQGARDPFAPGARAIGR